MGKKDTMEGEVGHGVWGRRTRRKGKTVKGKKGDVGGRVRISYKI